MLNHDLLLFLTATAAWVSCVVRAHIITIVPPPHLLILRAGSSERTTFDPPAHTSTPLEYH